MSAKRLLSGVVLGLALILASCSRQDLYQRLPEGVTVAGDTAALRRVLARAERLTLAPLGRDARELSDRIAGCELFLGSSSDAELAQLFRSIQCSKHDDLPAVARELRGKSDLVVLARLPDGSAFAGSARVAQSGAVVFDARFKISAEAKLAGLLLPDGAPPGPARLSSDDALLHAHFRPEGGLNIARLVPEQGQANDLFRLKSELFSGAVLDGSIEFAAWLPEPGRQIPPIALSVGFRFQRPAVAAMQKFVDELRQTWPIAPSPLTLAGNTGMCLDNLRILPEFAPCYVATEDALVIGWNKASIVRALEPSQRTLDLRGGLYVYLDRFPEADRRLRATRPVASEALDFEYGWDRLIARTSRQDGEYHLSLELQRTEPK